MHFLGGLWAGIFFLWVFNPKTASRSLTLRIALFVLAIGLGWEIFELLVDKVLSHNPFNILDTTADVFFDLAGGLTAVFYYVRSLGRRTR